MGGMMIRSEIDDGWVTLTTYVVDRRCPLRLKTPLEAEDLKVLVKFLGVENILYEGAHQIEYKNILLICIPRIEENWISDKKL